MSEKMNICPLCGKEVIDKKNSYSGKGSILKENARDTEENHVIVFVHRECANVVVPQEENKNE